MSPSQKKVTTASAQANTAQSGLVSHPRRRPAHNHELGPASHPLRSTSSSGRSSTRSRRYETQSKSTATRRGTSSTIANTAVTHATSMSDNEHAIEAAGYLQYMRGNNVDAASYWQSCPYSSCSDPSCWTHAGLAVQQEYYLTGVGARFTNDNNNTYVDYSEVHVDEENEAAWYGGDDSGPK